MTTSGRRHPRGLNQRILRTLFLRVPYAEWPAIIHGVKTEFRTSAMGAVSGVIDTPTPVVLYASSPARGLDRREGLMVLTHHHIERLHDIRENAEALAREGFASYDEFRAYWRERTHRPYRALQSVDVFRVERYRPTTKAALGEALLDRLYGSYLD